MADKSTTEGYWLPEDVSLRLTVFELGILTGVVANWARQNDHAPAAQRLLAKLYAEAERFYPKGKEPHPHG